MVTVTCQAPLPPRFLSLGFLCVCVPVGFSRWFEWQHNTTQIAADKYIQWLFSFSAIFPNLLHYEVKQNCQHQVISTHLRAHMWYTWNKMCIMMGKLFLCLYNTTQSTLLLIPFMLNTSPTPWQQFKAVWILNGKNSHWALVLIALLFVRSFETGCGSAVIPLLPNSATRRHRIKRPWPPPLVFQVWFICWLG